MKLIPFALIFATAIFCSSIRNKIDPTPTPLPTLGSTRQPSNDASPTNSDDPTYLGANEMPHKLPIPKTISGGALNGKTKSMPMPEYPAAAKAVRASGAVSVQVLVDEKGSVVSATAVSGHPLLKQAAVDAAKKALFEPTMMSGMPMKVSGVLTYNFQPE